MKKQILASVPACWPQVAYMLGALGVAKKNQIMIIVERKNLFRKILKSLGLMMQKDGALIKVTI